MYVIGGMILLFTLFFVYPYLDTRFIHWRMRKEILASEEKKKAIQEQIKAERLKQAKGWKESLDALGIHHSVESLLNMGGGRIFEENQLPLQTVFTQDEYSKLVSILLPEYVKRFDKDGCYKSVHLDELSVAVHAKELTVYVQKLEEALDVLVKKERWQTLSDKELEKKEELKSEIEQCKVEIKGYSEFQLDLNRTITEKGIVSGHVVFNPFTSFDEEKVLKLVTSIIGTGKPEMKEPVLKGTHVTSPALEELNTFLNENQLPDKTTQELIETMNLIERTLRAQHERTKLNNTLLQAKVLDETARKYHQIGDE
ncbi:hypothetical protein JMA_39070 (plasmid) [Jeotgalibacillus malaysiensis]|uniref:Uncharacterized protein n=1 Tax=Jeotgalibacillus malaysiensis TaxID=1508404 RepID=A0A0B5ASN8_9BACL|nr:hypothetical protein [Jeotgalibacillus malaysiensis]AJD93225.1 hypothetical protein JMA_39070 [Jeotgalibacillus malaysiensis]